MSTASNPVRLERRPLSYFAKNRTRDLTFRRPRQGSTYDGRQEVSKMILAMALEAANTVRQIIATDQTLACARVYPTIRGGSKSAIHQSPAPRGVPTPCQRTTPPGSMFFWESVNRATEGCEPLRARSRAGDHGARKT